MLNHSFIEIFLSLINSDRMATSARNPVKQSEKPLYSGGLANTYSFFIFFERQDRLFFSVIYNCYFLLSVLKAERQLMHECMKGREVFLST